MCQEPCRGVDGMVRGWWVVQLSRPSPVPSMCLCLRVCLSCRESSWLGEGLLLARPGFFKVRKTPLPSIALP